VKCRIKYLPYRPQACNTGCDYTASLWTVWIVTVITIWPT